MATDIRDAVADGMDRCRTLNLDQFVDPDDPFAMVPPQWEMFAGNNHNAIVNHRVSCGGMVNLAAHIGGPLSDQLWYDLVYRYQIERLRIIRHGEGMWADGPGENACFIMLDGDGNVGCIEISPRQVHRTPESWIDLLRALRVVVDEADGVESPPYLTKWSREEVPPMSIHEAREVLQRCWEWANEPIRIYELGPGVAVINDYATAKLRIE